MFDIWRERSELAELVYSGNNYKIRVNETARSEFPICTIYCSSNNIWYPNEEACFRRSFIENDYYEWRKTRIANVQKEIWIRDIYKSWYVTGINRELDSIEKLISFLKEETVGYDVILIGSSAGGYLASLLSKPLKAVRSIVFSAQFDLNRDGALSNNPFLQQYKGSKRDVFYDLSEYLKDSTAEIFYIYPNQNVQDLGHRDAVSDLTNIKRMGLKSKRHGMVVYKCCVPQIINMNNEQLSLLFKQYDGKQPFELSVKLVGWTTTIVNILHELNTIVMKVFNRIKK